MINKLKLAIFKNRGAIAAIAAVILPLLWTESAFATADNLGKVAENLVGTFGSLTKLITAGSYLAGLGFAIGALLKFKQHKDNPTQITIGQPIALLFIAAALLFLPTILGVTGASLFSTGGTVSGPSGTIFTTQ